MPSPPHGLRGRPLAANRDFVLIWGSGTVSALGTAVTSVALPLAAVVTLHASTLEVGYVAAAGGAAWIFFGLVSGVWVDRLPRRPLLVTCDLVRAAALLSVPVTAAAGALTLAQLVGVAFIISVGSVFFDVAHQSYVPAVVSRERLLTANSLLQGSWESARISGPVLGGSLVQLVGAPVTLLADMASYVVSALCLFATGKGLPREAPEANPAGLIAQVREGLGFVWHNPVLRPLMLAAASLNMFAGGAVTALQVVFLVRSLHLPPVLVGLLVAAEGPGAVLGAVVAGRLSRRVGNGRVVLLAVVAGPLFALLLPLATRGPALALFAVGAAGLALFTVVFSIVARVYRQTMVPPRMLGRVTAVNRFVSWGVIPVGALAAGALGSAIGNRPALWVSVLGLALLTPLPIAVSPLRRAHDLEAAAPPGPAAVPGARVPAAAGGAPDEADGRGEAVLAGSPAEADPGDCAPARET